MRLAGFRSACPHAFVISCLLLSACAAPRHRADTPTILPAPQASPKPAEPPAQPAVPVVERANPEALSPWPRLRSRFVLDSCNYSSTVLKSARSYTRSASIFVESLRQAMPFLLLVVDELERRDLPGEFALLPYVESHYRPIPAKGRGPAGMWQLMGRTAIDQGLQVTKDFDQRLDAVASTRVALDLIERYDREFGDWRVATMAFNAGEFRVKRQLGNQSASSMDAKELARLKLSPTTHRHLARLLALACIVEHPETFGIDLPSPEPDDFLEHLEFKSAIDIRLAANLMGMPLGELRRFNAAWRADPNHVEPVSGLLAPKSRVASFEENLRLIPEDQRAAWHEQRVNQHDSLTSLANKSNLSVEALAMANGMAPDATTSTGSHVLVPGPGPGAVSADNRGTYAVKPGDTLSAIAHRHGVRVAQLLRWNSLEKNSILHLDMQLRIRAPQY